MSALGRERSLAHAPKADIASILRNAPDGPGDDPAGLTRGAAVDRGRGLTFFLASRGRAVAGVGIWGMAGRLWINPGGRA
jgi:hypothetical protein